MIFVIFPFISWVYSSKVVFKSMYMFHLRCSLYHTYIKSHLFSQGVGRYHDFPLATILTYPSLALYTNSSVHTLSSNTAQAQYIPAFPDNKRAPSQNQENGSSSGRRNAKEIIPESRLAQFYGNFYYDEHRFATFRYIFFFNKNTCLKMRFLFKNFPPKSNQPIWRYF